MSDEFTTDTPAEETSETTQRSGRKKWPAITVVLGIATAFLPFWFFIFGPQMRHDKLLEKGVRAKGRLLAVEESGTVINDVPELELTVEFRRAHGTLDTATTDFVPTMRTLHMYQEGIAVTAAYDPDDPDELTIAELSTTPMQYTVGGTAAATAADSLARLADSLRRELDQIKGR
jgi:hypothetical protein